MILLFRARRIFFGPRQEAVCGLRCSRSELRSKSNNTTPKFDSVYLAKSLQSYDFYHDRSSLMSCTLEPAMWSRDTGQQIPCFDRCQLIITWMSNIKEVNGKPRLHVSVNLLLGVWPPSCATPSSSSSRVRAHEQYR